MCCFRTTLTLFCCFLLSLYESVLLMSSLEFVIQNVTYFLKTPLYHKYLYLQLRSYIRHHSIVYI